MIPRRMIIAAKGGGRQADPASDADQESRGLAAPHTPMNSPTIEPHRGCTSDPDFANPARLLAAIPDARPVLLSDRAVFELALRGRGSPDAPPLGEPISDMSFAASLCWGEPLSFAWTVLAGHLCLFSAADGDLCLVLPPLPVEPGNADNHLADAIRACFVVMDEANGLRPGRPRSRIEYVSDEMLLRIRAAEQGSEPPLSVTPMPGDYVYRREALVELAGGDLKSKRKLRSRFLRENPDATTADITPDDIPDCLELASIWRESSDIRHEGEANERLIGVDVLRERDARCTARYLESAAELGLPTMLVRSRGTLVGFTIGEALTPTMASVAVEKTHPDYPGTPQFIYSEFCRTRLASFDEINAGDDWGIDTLRFTKSAYRPSRMLCKHILAREPISEIGLPEPATVRLLARGRPAHQIPEAAVPSATAVRPATRDDAGAILAIEEAAFTATTDRFTARQVRRLLENPRARVAVAERDNAIIGWSVALVRTHQRSRSGRVYSVAVLPQAAGSGVGRALITSLLDSLERDGIERVYLEVRCTNATAIALYTSVGFEPIRTLTAYYGEIDGIRMRRVRAP